MVCLLGFEPDEVSSVPWEALTNCNAQTRGVGVLTIREQVNRRRPREFNRWGLFVHNLCVMEWSGRQYSLDHVAQL